MELTERISAFLAARGKNVDFSARRPLADLEDQAEGKGAYIARWDASLGAAPTEADGFSAYELHRVNK